MSSEDGNLMIMTHIDPVFLLIPIFQAVEFVSPCEAFKIFAVIKGHCRQMVLLGGFASSMMYLREQHRTWRKTKAKTVTHRQQLWERIFCYFPLWTALPAL